MKTPALAPLLLLLSTAPITTAAVQLVPYRLEESRSITLINDNIGRSPDTLKITFALKGPEAASAAQYGDLKFDEAVDDRGTNLIPTKDVFGESKKFKDFSNDFFRKMSVQQNQPPADPQVDINLSKSSRAATKIAHLRGSFALSSTGSLKKIELTNLTKITTQKLDIPPTANIAITVSLTPSQQTITSLDLIISGTPDVLNSTEILDASGKKVSNGTMSFTSPDGTEHRSIDLERPLDDSMKLVVKLSLNRKITRVPFDLTNIALP